MKKSIAFAAAAILFFCFAKQVLAQRMVNKFGAFLRVENNASLRLQNIDFVNQGMAINQGQIEVEGDLVNYEFFQNLDTLTIHGDLTSTSGFNFANPIPSRVVFAGNANSIMNGELSASLLVMDKQDAKLSLNGYVFISTEVRFQQANNPIELNDFNLVLNPSAVVTGASNSSFIITNGLGNLSITPTMTGSFTFPVGFATGQYNPVTITQNGTPDGIYVRALEHPLTAGSSGSPIAEGTVDAAWEINENFPGDSDFELSFQWAANDELPGFMRNDCGVARYESGTDYDLPPANMGAASGMGPFTHTRTGLQSGIFTISGEDLMNRVKLSPRILLQGPYNATNDNMNDQLRSLPAFPISAPSTYGTGKFGHAGRQPVDGYSIDPSVLTATGSDAIVDWVFIWLKDPANPATNLQTTLALLQKDGDVVGLDGTSPLDIPGNAGNYILGIGHRNHLSVRSPNGTGISLGESTPTPYDFSTGIAQAHGTNPMKLVDSSPVTYALWGGNANENTSVRATGPAGINDYSAILSVLGTPSNILTSVYNKADLNLDGTVRATGPTNINDYSRLLNYLGSPATIVNEQF